MGFTLEYNRRIYKNQNEDVIIFVNKLGSNNVWDTETHLRPREWYLEMIGTEAEYWQRIGSRLESVEGGMIQRAVGWTDYKYFNALEYIKLYRSKLRNALPLEEFTKDFSVSYSYRVHADNCSDDLKNAFDYYNIEVNSEGFYSDIRYFTNTEDLLIWLKYFPTYSWGENSKCILYIHPRKTGL